MSRALTSMTILDALADPHLFGGLDAFKDLSTWHAWIVFMRALYGLPMTADEARLFCQCTGRTRYVAHPGGYPEAVAIVGRQSGKSRVASLIQAFEAITAPKVPERGEHYALSLAQDQRAALRVLFAYAAGVFEAVPLLSRQVVASRQDARVLKNGITLACYPCRPAAIRGLRARVIVADELAFYRNSENLPVDAEMLRAARPCLATTGGKLIILSSPYGQSGALWDLHRRYYGRDDADTLIWQASAPVMNPTLPINYLTRMEADDPEAYRSEVLGEFRAGLSMLLDPEAIAACVLEGVRERAPIDGVNYTAFCDPSGGRRDAFTLAIAHKQGEVAILDALYAWGAPFNPAGAIAEAVDRMLAYRVRTVHADRYGAEFTTEQFRARGVTLRPSDLDRSALYLALLPAINARQVALLDVPELLRELRGLERRRGASGRDRVDHGPGAHDDRANSVAGVVATLITRRKRPEWYAL